MIRDKVILFAKREIIMILIRDYKDSFKNNEWGGKMEKHIGKMKKMAERN